ncbi:hypothetical protein EV368DRAFT_68538 [Lentinula lateritia]|nr:hypothetical protein EV368DRAFT_68538 [Lentinula lateritia]
MKFLTLASFILLLIAGTMTTVDAIASSPDKACKVLHNGLNGKNKSCSYYAGQQKVDGTCQDKHHRVFTLTCVPNALKGSVDNASAASATLAASAASPSSTGAPAPGDSTDGFYNVFGFQLSKEEGRLCTI